MSTLAMLPDSHQSWHALLELEFTRSGDKTILSRRRHQGPLLVQKALYPEGGRVCHAVILHPPAGIAGGDHLKIDLNVDTAARALASTPGATKWYKSNGRPASQSISINVGKDAHLDFLPQENIYFNQVCAQSTMTMRQSQGSSLIAWDISQLGRTASGESWQDAAIQLDSELYLDERLVWVESVDLQSACPFRKLACGMADFAVMGSMWLSAPAASRDLAELHAETLPWSDGLRAGMSHLHLPGSEPHGLIVIRALAHETEDLKNLFIRLWMAMRESICAIEAQRLRLWNT